MRIAIDFDGVIHDHRHPVEGKGMGKPVEGAMETLTALRDSKNEIIIFTARGDHQYVHAWFKLYQIPYDSITNVKPNADAYIMHDAIRFTSWEEIKLTPQGKIKL